MSELIQRYTDLPSQVIHFAKYLRSHEFSVGIDDSQDLLECYRSTLPQSDLEQYQLFKSLWVKSRQQYLRFDELYKTYWSEITKAENSAVKKVEEETLKKKINTQQSPSISELKQWLYDGKIESEEEVAYYSAFEALSKKNFTNFTFDEQNEIFQILKILAQRLANKTSRRFKKSNRAKQLDFKKSIRKALASNAEINQLFFKKQKIKKLNLILLCDVSKSMEIYSQFLIHFLYSFQQAVFELKTFAFSTELVSLSHIFRETDYQKVLRNLSEQVPHWSGGTRIGSSLDMFINNHSSKILNSKSIVMILSDGWDTGDSELLTSSMKYLHKKSNKVIWINPLAGQENFSPSTKAMEVSLPYIDQLCSAHNIESLRGLVTELNLSNRN